MDRTNEEQDNMPTSELQNSAKAGEPEADEPRRRDFIHIAAASFAAVGIVASFWPIIASLYPAADVIAEGTITVDLGPIEPGQRITVEWRRKPVFIHHRTPEEVAAARSAPLLSLPDPQLDRDRVKRDEWLVVVGVCTHLGCVPKGQLAREPRGDYGGWFCPCHGSQYDTSGRVRRGPAPINLEVPPYRFMSDAEIRLG
ncbi:MAG TPA: ubiquinol-cytochrome c reductase iron-sulfur subunit [Hyphomonadaceae bacterium]|jgi:ubiquinol-cytochrome c reductase iron-sulfur subunit